MSSIQVQSNASGAGIITLASPNTGTNYTLTLPAQTGTISVVGPAFSVYTSSSQTLTSSTWTKIQCNAETFDTNNAFDSVTNYRFQPTVAGYYQINGAVDAGTSTSLTRLISGIWKNASSYKSGVDQNYTGAKNSTVSDVVYLNGSTDYVELWAYIIASSAVVTPAFNQTYFSGRHRNLASFHTALSNRECNISRIAILIFIERLEQYFQGIFLNKRLP